MIIRGINSEIRIIKNEYKSKYEISLKIKDIKYECGMSSLVYINYHIKHIINSFKN
jgi:hypothetical protein